MRGDIAHHLADTLRLVQRQTSEAREFGHGGFREPAAASSAAVGLGDDQPDRIGEVAGEISTRDALVVAAYGQILRSDTLRAARLGAFNVHASLLPRYRGAAPIERAIMNGDTQTGVTIMKMDEGLDTGPIALQYSIPILPDMSGGDLTEALADLGSKAIVESMSNLSRDSLTFIEQDSEHATYAPKLEDEERVIRWGEGVGRVQDLIRALTPHVGARTFHPDLQGPIKVLRSRIFSAHALEAEPGTILPAKDAILVACGEGVLEVLELQVPGSRVLPAREYLRGNRLEGLFTG